MIGTAYGGTNFRVHPNPSASPVNPRPFLAANGYFGQQYLPKIGLLPGSAVVKF